MSDLARLRLEVRLTRFVLIIAAVAFLAGAVIQQPDVDTLTLQRLELVDDDGAVVGSIGVNDGEPVMVFSSDDKVCRIRPSSVVVSGRGKVAAVSEGRVTVIGGLGDMSVVAPGVMTTKMRGATWVSTDR